MGGSCKCGFRSKHKHTVSNNRQHYSRRPSSLGGDRISSEPNDRGRLILGFLNFFNLKAVNFDSVCTVPIDTFFSSDGQFSSAIDLIVVPRALIPNVNWAYVFEKEAENLSDHVPVTVSIKLSVLKQSIDEDPDLPSYGRKHISWQK